ncbi:MAG: lipase family alpha/beta hydrolase [Polyangiaceae bacterium]
MLRTIAVAALFGSLALGCSGAPTEETDSTSATSDELVACGWLTGGTCAKLPSGNWRSPQFWGDFYLAKYASERAYYTENIEPGPTPLTTPRTVLLITGITIPAEWFNPIKARLERDGFKTVVYEPPALLSGDLEKASEDLGAVVDKALADSGDSTIDILAECTGGVIARRYIQSLGGDGKIAHMVTFVSPEHGLPMAPLVHALVGWPALNDLTPGSKFLTAVNGAALPSDVKFTSIYSCTDIYISPMKTSEIPGADNIEICDGATGHFEAIYEPSVYMMMHDALLK